MVLHGGALGDCVLTLHVVAALRAAAPGIRLDMVARSPVAPLAAEWGPLDAAWSSDDFGLHHLHGHGPIPPPVADRFMQYDLVINFLGGPDQPVSRRLAEVARGRALSVDPAPRAGETPRHITRQWLDDLNRLGVRLEPANPQVLFPSAAERGVGRAALERLAGRAGGRIAVCHPGAGGRNKCCALPTLERVVVALGESGVTALWMVGPTELDWHGPALVERLRSTAPVVFEESVPATARLLAGADVFIGHDAGMTHLAAALGVATVALFGPTDPGVWAPRGPDVRVLEFRSGGEDGMLVNRIVAEVVA